jgi:hypothetical protein
MALYVIWLLLLTLMATICTYIVAPCFVIVINRSYDDPVLSPSKLLRNIFIPVLVVVAVLISLLGNIQIAIMTMSIVIFVESEFGFDSGRTHSDIGERIPSGGSMVLLISLGLAAISMAYSFARFIAWYYFAIPIVLWFIIGQVTLEADIRKYMRRAKARGREGSRFEAIEEIRRNSRGGLRNTRY